MGDKLQMCHPEFISGSKRELKGGRYRLCHCERSEAIQQE